MQALPAPGRPGAEATWFDHLVRLDFGSYWRFFVKQPPSFWFVSLYLFFEYVRPQSIYRSMDVLPWAQWTVIGCVVAVALEGKLFKRVDASDGWLLAFTAVVIASCFTAVYPKAAFEELSLYLSWALMFVLITRAVDTQTRLFFFYFLFLLFSLKMSQHATRSWFGAGFRFRSWGATGAPGWFRNSGEMAIQMTIFLPLSVYFAMALKPHLQGLSKRWKYWAVMLLPLSAVIALLASSSRGGQLGGVAVLLWMLLKSRRRMRGFLALALVGGAVWFVLPAEQKTRFTEMGTDDTSESRITYWKNGIEMANDYPVLGIGYDNWVPYYRANYGIGQLPHNIFVQAGAELGYVGLAVFLGLIGMTFRMNYRTRRRSKGLPHGRVFFYMAHGLDAALIGYMVSGFFVTVLYYPYFWINYAMTAALFKVVSEQARKMSAPRPAPAPPVRQVRPAGTRLAGARSG